MKRAFEGITIAAISSLLCILLLEAGAWFYVRASKEQTAKLEILPPAKMEIYRKMFPDMTETEIGGMFFTYKQIYAPWVDFRNADIDTPRVHAKGFLRRTDPEYSSAPEGALDVFFFGGSTMQGVHVPDDRTLPSAFISVAAKSPEVRFRAFNYGQPYFHLKQEAALFLDMLMDGKRPRVAVFLDGLNDLISPGATYAGTPFFTPAFAWLFDQPYRHAGLGEVMLNTNLYKVITRDFEDRKLADTVPKEVANLNYSLPSGVDPRDVYRRIADSYVRNVNLLQSICKAENIICLFFLQPIPFLGYDQSADIISMRKDPAHFKSSYDAIKQQLANTRGFYPLDNAFAPPRELPYVDAVHYSPYGNRVLAELIHEKVREHVLRGER
jgi:lysophospholipase L1-like esterase